MNLALSDEQELLREAARGTLARAGTVAAARAALEDPSAAPDLWPLAVEAGWPGLLIAKDHGGAGLGAFDAMLVAQECGRVLAGVPLLGLLPATALLDAGGHERVADVAAGEVRAAWLPARPADDLGAGWTVDRARGAGREPAPPATIDGDAVTFSGTVPWVPDARGAELLVVVGATDDDAPVAGAIEASAATVEPVVRYDATRPLAHVTLDGARGARLDVSAEQI